MGNDAGNMIAGEAKMDIYCSKRASMPSVADLAWLAGKWSGARDGTSIEEQWSKPAGRALMGMFRWLQDGRVCFYEFMTIEQEVEGIVLRIKRFAPGLIPWEEEQGAAVFGLVEANNEEAVFVQQDVAEPLWIVYQRVDEDSLVAYLGSEGGPLRPEDAFRFRRCVPT
jgi:hypothetical protein